MVDMVIDTTGCSFIFSHTKKIKILLKSTKKAVFILNKIILLNVQYDHLFLVQSNQVFFSYLKKIEFKSVFLKFLNSRMIFSLSCSTVDGIGL